MDQETFRQQVVLALLSDMNGWMPSMDAFQLAPDILGETIPKNASIQELLTYRQRIIAVLLDQQVTAILKQLSFA